jgi:PAS domain S-box-containing protein
LPIDFFALSEPKHNLCRPIDCSPQDSYLLSALLENTSDSIYFKDRESRFVRISQAMAAKLGLACPEDAIGKCDRDFFTAEHADKAFQDEQQIIRTGRPIVAKEERETWPDATETWVVTNKMALGDCDGNVVGTFGISHDITRIKAAEAALRLAHRESDLFIDSVPSILIGVDATGCIKRWNLAAAATFGLAEADVREKPLTNCGIAWLDPEISKEIDTWLAAESSVRRDNIAFQRGSEKRFLGLTVKRVIFTDAGGVNVMIMGADTTERTQLELQLRQAQKLEAIGQLAAGIAHEINTPAQYVRDNLAFVKEAWPGLMSLVEIIRPLNQKGREQDLMREVLNDLDRALTQIDTEYLRTEIPGALDQSLEGIERIAKIVRAMNEFSHPGSSDKQDVDLNRAIETAIAVSRNEWKYVAEIETRLDRTVPLVACFASEFNQVIINLLVNAAHAIEERVTRGDKGLIIVGSRCIEGFVEIYVKDNGPGIPTAIRSRVFEPFFTTKGVGKGTGQGLAIAHRVIVNRHEGAIWFDTEIGAGTTFYLRLPLTPKQGSNASRLEPTSTR